MADVNSVSGYDVAPSTLMTTEKSTSGSSLGKSEFLSLLVTQMKYQDPLEPTDDKEFIAQMAQFSSLEQMQNLNTSFDKYRAYSLVGKNIEATVNGETISGFVDRVNINGSGNSVVVDDISISVDKITSVNDTAEELQIMAGILQNVASLNQKIVSNPTDSETETSEESAPEDTVEGTAENTVGDTE